MKVIFLDIDGVLNTAAGHVYWIRKGEIDEDTLDPIACSNLQYVLDRIPDLQIVISSTWRLSHPLEKIKSILKKNGIDSDRVIGVTPKFRENRGREIEGWLKENPEVKDFLIVDDDSDMEPLMERLVKCRSYDGVTMVVACEMLQRLGEKAPMYLL